MTVSGPYTFVTGTNDATIGTVAWSNPDRAAGTNTGDFSSCTLNNATSNYQFVTESLTDITPSTDEVTQIVFVVTHLAQIGIVDHEVKLIIGGTVQSDNQAGNGGWSDSGSTTDATYTFDTSALGITGADVNATNFGLAIACRNPNTTNRGVRLYHVTVTITHAAASGPTYTLTADAGSYTVTGQAATLAASRQLALDVGSYTVTGNSAGLLASRLLNLDTGNYTLTGNDAGIIVGRLLSAGSGSYTVTGNDAGLIVSRLLSAGAGSYTITGYDVTLTYNPAGGPTYTLALDAGSYAVTGRDAGLIASRLLTADTGSYALAGGDVTMLAHRLLSAAAGSYTLTGGDVAMLVSRILGTDAGSYTVTGHPVTFSYSNEVLQIYTADVIINITPTGTVTVNPTPTVTAAANPSPHAEVMSG